MYPFENLCMLQMYLFLVWILKGYNFLNIAWNGTKLSEGLVQYVNLRIQPIRFLKTLANFFYGHFSNAMSKKPFSAM